jgi:hypothetical protein
MNLFDFLVIILYGAVAGIFLILVVRWAFPPVIVVEDRVGVWPWSITTYNDWPWWYGGGGGGYGP